VDIFLLMGRAICNFILVFSHPVGFNKCKIRGYVISVDKWIQMPFKNAIVMSLEEFLVWIKGSKLTRYSYHTSICSCLSSW
jgi:hypothetical protein